MKSTVFLKLLAVVVLSIASVNTFAQVRIGTDADPDSNAMLDLRGAGATDGKGVLFPRVALSDYDDVDDFATSPAPGMTVYNIGVTDAPLSAGVYVWDGARWNSTNSIDGEWFYMPSTLINVDPGNDKQINLFTEFVKYENKAVGSAGAPPVTKSLTPGNAGDYFYYVIDYDDTVFRDIVIASNGSMTYDVIAPATESTYINIIFVRK